MGLCGAAPGCGCAIGSEAPLESEIALTWPTISFVGTGKAGSAWGPVLDSAWVTEVAAVVNGVGAWTAPTLENSYVNLGSGHQVAQYRKVGDIVQVRGTVNRGTLTSGLVIFTLPVGYRPPAPILMAADVQDRLHSRLDVNVGGGVIAYFTGASAGGYVAMGFIQFSTVA